MGNQQAPLVSTLISLAWLFARDGRCLQMPVLRWCLIYCSIVSPFFFGDMFSCKFLGFMCGQDFSWQLTTPTGWQKRHSRLGLRSCKWLFELLHIAFLLWGDLCSNLTSGGVLFLCVSRSSSPPESVCVWLPAEGNIASCHLVVIPWRCTQLDLAPGSSCLVFRDGTRT